MVVSPTTLSGNFVRLEPLAQEHAASLAKHADHETFRYFATLRPREISIEGLQEFIAGMQSLPNVMAFAIVLQESGEAIGSTSFLDIRTAHRGLEVGYTWISAKARGTNVNPEIKLLMLQHAFDGLGCVRVQLKTDGRNLQSQAAITKLGAAYEGVLRKHIIMPDGFVRDTVMYSIIAEEWPIVKARLLQRLRAS